MGDVAWRDAIIEVLKKEDEALHYTTIAERIVSAGLRETVGATPAATVNSTITTSLRNEGDDSPFRRVSRGEYVLATQLETKPSRAASAEALGEEETLEGAEGPIQALGMFWDRGLVQWTSNPAILGRQQIGADVVDMAEQRGIYLLHDVRDVVYIGRCTDRPLGRRLYEHTYDRLNPRWTRFSWFGLRPVLEDGTLGELADGHSADVVITAMEALLIEALEPPQNRRRGDGFSGVEFIQAVQRWCSPDTRPSPERSSGRC